MMGQNASLSSSSRKRKLSCFGVTKIPLLLFMFLLVTGIVIIMNFMMIHPSNHHIPVMSKDAWETLQSTESKIVSLSPYWKQRKDSDLYKRMEQLARRDASNALTVLDVGAYESPYLLRLDWIPTKIATDIQARPQVWEHMNGVAFIQGDFLQLRFGNVFDLVICNQVLEHLPDDSLVPFVTKLASMARVLIVSTTYNMPSGMIAGHVQDPISEEKFRSWFQNVMELGSITDYYHPPSPKTMQQMWQVAVWKRK